MTSVFPLYDSIYQEVTNENEMLQEKKMNLCNEIKELDKEGHELVYAIIRNYFLLHEKVVSDELPYSPKVIKHGLKFDTSIMPNRLLHMLDHFVKLHRMKIQEDQSRAKLDIK